MGNLIKCKDCGKKVSVNATMCPNCGAPVVLPVKREKKKGSIKHALIGLTILFVLALAMCSSDPDDTKKQVAEPEQIAPTTGSVSTEDNAVVEEAPKDDGLTAQQKNAVRSAENYISVMGFSRKGLIGQLSSDYGDGYSVDDATIAVDSMSIDYNEQAAKSAKNYLGVMGFSCSGLVDQLSSDAGDQYTKEQAKYGAKAAGACD